MFVPGEPEIGGNFAANVSSSLGNSATHSGGGSSVHMLHPVQFGGNKPEPAPEQPDSQYDTPQSLAHRAKGIPLESQLHHARDLALSGHSVQQYQPRGLTNTAIRMA